MKRLAFIELTIMLDDNSPWRNLAHFEQSIDDYFAAHGMEVNDVEVRGNTQKIVKYITKIDSPPKINPQPMTFKKGK